MPPPSRRGPRAAASRRRYRRRCPAGPLALTPGRRRRRARAALWLAGLALVLLLAGAVATAFGSAAIPLPAVLRVLGRAALGLPVNPADRVWETIILQVRLPRVVLAGLVGLGLATAGAVMQGLFRNPMADPGMLGVSSGGALGAVIGVPCMLATVGCIVVALLDAGLLDVDAIIRKSLVYGILWLLIALGFVAAASVLGVAASRQLPLAVAITLAPAAKPS